MLQNIYFSIFSILSSYTIYDEWQHNPVLTTIGTTGLPIEKVKFPSITICGQGSSKDILDKAMFRQMTDHLAAKGKNTTGMTPENVGLDISSNTQLIYLHKKFNIT